MNNNIFDYIDKYGNMSFTQKPFNSVDGLILSQFSYLKLDGIVPEVGEHSSPTYLRDIAISSKYEEVFSDERYAENNRAFYKALALTIRFGLIKLNHYINLVNRKVEMQFSAVCCELDNGVNFIAYRGTDESIVGWKEDFNMAFTTPIPAQLKAVSYLNYAAERIKGNFIVGGHSKGGNLAVYAAMKCHKGIRDRIDTIYSFDGPGFTRQALVESDYQEIKSRIIKLVPKSSIVGMLLQNQEEYRVVDSKKFGILQHDPYNWVVNDDDFVYLDSVKEAYMIQNTTLTEWATNTNPESMKLFADNLYRIIEEIGISDLNDIKGSNYTELIKGLSKGLEDIDEDQKEIMKEVGKALVSTFIETIKNQSNISKTGV